MYKGEKSLFVADEETIRELLRKNGVSDETIKEFVSDDGLTSGLESLADRHLHGCTYLGNDEGYHRFALHSY